MAASVARGCAVPAAPDLPMAADRLAKVAPDTRSPAWTSGRTKRSSPGAWNFGNEGSVEGAAGPPKSVVPDSGSRPGPDNPPPIPAIPIVTVARNERRCNVASWGSATSPVAYQLGCTRPRPCSAGENGTLFCFERGTLAKQAPGFPIEI